MVYCCSKSPHQLQVEVAVIFISCSVDDIEIPRGIDLVLCARRVRGAGRKKWMRYVHPWSSVVIPWAFAVSPPRLCGFFSYFTFQAVRGFSRIPGDWVRLLDCFISCAQFKLCPGEWRSHGGWHGVSLLKLIIRGTPGGWRPGAMVMALSSWLPQWRVRQCAQELRSYSNGSTGPHSWKNNVNLLSSFKG
jgi:hypothetical protein